MVKITPIQYETLPTGDYIARIAKIEADDGEYGPQLRWRFEIIEPTEFENSTITSWCSATLTEKSKAYQWVKAAQGGQDIDWEQDFDFDDIVGRIVVMSLSVKINKAGSERNKVESLRVYKPTRKPKPAPAPDASLSPEDLKQEAAQGNGNGSHWVDNAAQKAQFFATAGNDFGLNHADILKALNVPSIRDYAGSMDDALTALMAFAATNGAGVQAQVQPELV